MPDDQLPGQQGGTPPTPPSGSPGAGSGAPATPPQNNSGASGGDDFQARFLGLQRHVDSTLATLGYRSLQEVPNLQTVSELRLSVSGLPALQTALSDANTKLATAQAAQIQAETAAQKMRLIAEVDPVLLGLADNIPTDPDAAKQKSAIESFKLTLTNLGFQRGTPNGAAPPIPPAGNPPVNQAPTAENVWAQAMEAMKAGKVDEYGKLMDEYRKLNSSGHRPEAVLRR
jgi:hypothetical protein